MDEGSLMRIQRAILWMMRIPGIYSLDMRRLKETENIFVEPSACAAFEGPVKITEYEEAKTYLESHRLTEKMEGAAHVAWATGGRLVPEEIRRGYEEMYL